jgi:hypothetical protein
MAVASRMAAIRRKESLLYIRNKRNKRNKRPFRRWITRERQIDLHGLEMVLYRGFRSAPNLL